MSQLAHALDARSALDTARFPSDARLALRLLERMRHGRLDVTFPDGQRIEEATTMIRAPAPPSP